MSYKNILLIKPSALGDIVLSLPAFNSLRRSFPEAKITWLVRGEFASVFEGSPNPDRLLLFDRRKMGRWYCSPGGFRELMSFMGQLTKERFDLVIDLQGLFRTGLFSWLTRSPLRLGMDTAREGSRMFYTCRIKPETQPMHLIDYYNSIVAAAGGEVLTTEAELRPEPRAVEFAQKLLAAEKADVNAYAVFVVGAAQEYKIWPAEHFARLAQGLKMNYGLSVVAVGTEKEKKLIETVQVKSDVPILNLAGRTTIQQLMAVLAGARLAVTNDTGPGHIAAATGTPTVFIFGPTNPARVGPYGHPEAVAAVDAFERGPAIESDNPEHTIDKVSVEAVYQAIENTFHARGSANAGTALM